MDQICIKNWQKIFANLVLVRLGTSWYVLVLILLLVLFSKLQIFYSKGVICFICTLLVRHLSRDCALTPTVTVGLAMKRTWPLPKYFQGIYVFCINNWLACHRKPWFDCVRMIQRILFPQNSLIRQSIAQFFHFTYDNDILGIKQFALMIEYYTTKLQKTGCQFQVGQNRYKNKKRVWKLKLKIITLSIPKPILIT